MFEKNKEVQDFKTIFYINPRPQVIELPDVKEKQKIDVTYPLLEPFASAHIHWDNENNELVYEIEEPKLDQRETEVLGILENGINELINISFIGMKNTEVVIEYLEKNIRVLLDELKINISKESFLKLMYYIYRDFVGLNEIEPLLKDYYIEDIECNGVNTPIYIVHRKYRNIRTNIIFKETRKLTNFVEKLAQKCGKYISYASPLLDAALPDGSIDFEEPIIYKKDGIVKISKIGDFVDKYYSGKESNIPIKVKNIEVPAFDKDTLKINWKKVDYVYRHKNNEDLYEINLEFGRKVRLTGCHSLFVLTKNGIQSKRTDELTENDFAVIPLNIPENDLIKEIKVAEELSKTKYSKKLIIDGIPRSLFQAKKQEILVYLKNNYKRFNQAYYEHKKKRTLPLNLFKLLNENDLRKCKIRPTSAVSLPTFIKIDEDFIRFLGLYAAEGWLHNNSSNFYGVYFSLNKEETDLIEILKNSSRKCFGLDIHVEHEINNAVKVHVNSYLLWILLNEILKISKGATIKRIPELIFNVNKNLQQEFLKYWSLGDYGSTASKQLANDISYLSLFNNNIVPFYYRERESPFDKTRKTLSHEYYTNFFVRECNNPYYTMIPTLPFNPLNLTSKKFNNKRINRERFKKIIKNIKNKISNNHPAFIYEWTKKGFFKDKKPTEKFNEFLREIDIVNKVIDSDLGFLKIISLNKVKPNKEFVYDLSVKNHENFIGGHGGVCCHNSRLNASYTQDISSRGPSFTIRRFTKEPWTPIKLMQFNTVSPEMLAYLWLLIENEANIMIIGGTGSGKTSFLNGLAFFIPPAARVVSIEDTRELNILHENWLPGVTREGVGISNLIGTKEGEITLFDLLRESFRQRPDYVIVGEVRGREAYVLFQGMSSLRGDEEIFLLNNNKPLRIKIKDLNKYNLQNLKVISYDLENKKQLLLPLNGFIRHPQRKKLYKISTKLGREVTVTPDHSIFTLKENKIIDIRTDDLVIGSKIIIPSSIPCSYHNIAYINLLEYLPDLRIFAPDKIREASNKMGYYQASNLCQCSSITDYYSDFKRSKPSAIKAEHFLKLMKEADVKFDLKEIEARYDKKSKSFNALLELNEDFLKFLGYYLSEGTIGKGKSSKIALYNQNEEILNDMKRVISNLTGSKPKERITDRGYGWALELSFSHKVLHEFIRQYCGRKEEKKIPDFIFGLDKRRIGTFLGPLYAGDGGIKQSHFDYYTTSRKLANDVAQLLLTFGIVATIGKRNREGRKTTDYEIKFYASYKKEEFSKYVKPISKEIKLKLFNKKDRKLLGDLYCDEVKSIEIINLEKGEYVYDLSVSGTQNFIGGFGSILLHNSGHPSFGTMHAEDVETMIRRLETPPIELSASLVESLDVVCVITQAKVQNKEVRRIKEIVEIISVKEDLGGLETNTPFVWDPRNDKFYIKAESKVFEKIVLHRGISLEKLNREFDLRTKLLMALYRNNIVGFKEVYDIINAYYKTPELVLKKFNII